ncbi:MAG: hypothetical protein IPG75_13750 [Gemmatimonadetes bacterium]|nr:hypothetical protein [Gemmatimonadota bacterium]
MTDGWKLKSKSARVFTAGSRTPHGGLQAARIAQLDVGAEQGGDGLAGGQGAIVTAPEHVVERLEGAGHLEIDELRLDALAE